MPIITDSSYLICQSLNRVGIMCLFLWMHRRGGAPSECQITYGAPVQFALAKEDLSDAPLYLASDTVSAIGATNPKSGHRWVFLHSDSDDYNTMWKVEHIDPQYRMESEGLPVPVSF